MFDFARYLDNGKAVFCIKDIHGKVLYQNKVCIELCDVLVNDNKPCDKNCMKRYIRDEECPEREEGTSYFPCQLVEGRYYDIVFINDGQTLTSILTPLEERHEVDVEYFTKHGDLTPKEIEIMSLIIKKNTNKDICSKLNLKINTLKKHINNIYQKLPPAVATKLRNEYR